MAELYRVLERQDLTESARDLFARDVLMGLSAPGKTLPSRYFYDARGSELFQAITELPEYYLTECEHEILLAHGDRLVDSLGGEPFNLVELGAGDGRKTKVLLRRFLDAGLEFSYTPIDISEKAVAELTEALAREHPALTVQGLVSEYFDGIKWMKRSSMTRNMVLFLGSNIGNFSPAEADRFLLSLWSSMRSGDLLLIGFDLKKDIDVLIRAYSDKAGVTRAFNYNLLERINRELGGHFNPSRFQHVATYNFQAEAMQSFLVAKMAHGVRVERLKRTFEFDEWEAIHVESSHKFSLKDIETLAARTGFKVMDHLLDERRWFCDSLWRVQKD